MQQDETAGPKAERFARHELLERLDGDEELIREVLAIFLEDTPKILEEVKKGIDGGVPETVAKSAHTLKGSSANISANRLRDYAYQLELKAKSGDLAGTATLYAALETEFAALRNQLNRYLAQ